MDEVLKAKRQPTAGSSSRAITIRGAREHNLKNVDVEIRATSSWCSPACPAPANPRSRSTPSTPRASAAVESLSAYARQFLEMMQKPDVDQIDGLSPAISIEQKTTSKNPRSTVGTVTEIYDYMRLLWARVGVPYSPATGLPIEPDRLADGRPRAGAARGHEALSAGAGRARPQGRVQEGARRIPQEGLSARQDRRHVPELAEAPSLDKKFPHDIDVVVDRNRGAPRPAQRLAESFETALKLAEGLAVIEYADAPSGSCGDKEDKKKTAKIHDKSGPERILFSEKFACPVSGFTIPEIEPRLFSFNNPYGACPACGGIGVEQHIDEDLVIPDKDLTCARARSRPGRNRPRPITSRP